MERESFIFYRSFHEAIKCLPDKIRGQLYVAVADYALDGKEPENLCGEAQGMFMLMRPVIDKNNSLYTNGKKGGRPRKKSKEEAVFSTSTYNLNFNEETEALKNEEIWIDGVCKNFETDKEEILKRLDRFALHCATECSDKPHTSIADAKRHFTSWMRKAYADKPSESAVDSIPDPPDYTFKGGFGGLDV